MTKTTQQIQKTKTNVETVKATVYRLYDRSYIHSNGRMSLASDEFHAKNMTDALDKLKLGLKHDATFNDGSVIQSVIISETDYVEDLSYRWSAKQEKPLESPRKIRTLSKGVDY